MKYAFVAVALVAAVHAQTIDDVPSCALPCLTEAITGESDCDSTDFACACENIEAIRGAATACVVEECGAETALNEVLPAVEALCTSIGDGSGDDTEEDPEETPEETPEDDPEEVPEEEEDDDDAVPLPTPTPEPTEYTTVEHTTVIETTYTSVETHPTHVPTNGTTPEPTPIPTGGAAALGSVGGIALAGLAVLAL